jgi:hypothetical protein
MTLIVIVGVYDGDIPVSYALRTAGEVIGETERVASRGDAA